MITLVLERSEKKIQSLLMTIAAREIWPALNNVFVRRKACL
jgi:hypothetical protein